MVHKKVVNRKRGNLTQLIFEFKIFIEIIKIIKMITLNFHVETN